MGGLSEFEALPFEQERGDIISAMATMLKEEKKKRSSSSKAFRRASADQKLSQSSTSSTGSDPLPGERTSSEKLLSSSSSGSRDRDDRPLSEFDLQFAAADTSSSYKQLKEEMAERRMKLDKAQGVALFGGLRFSRTSSSRSSLLSVNFSENAGDGPKASAPWARRSSAQSTFTCAENNSDPLMEELTKAAQAVSLAGDLHALQSPPASVRDKLNRARFSAPLNRKVEGVPTLVIQRATSPRDMRIMFARALKLQAREERAVKHTARRAAVDAARKDASVKGSASSSALGSVFSMVAQAVLEKDGSRQVDDEYDDDDEGFELEEDGAYTLEELCDMLDAGVITEDEFNELQQQMKIGRHDKLVLPGDDYF